MRRTALVQLIKTFLGWCALVGALALLNGALPAVFAMLIALLVETLPDDDRHVVGARGWNR